MRYKLVLAAVIMAASLCSGAATAWESVGSGIDYDTFLYQAYYDAPYELVHVARMDPNNILTSMQSTIAGGKLNGTYRETVSQQFARYDGIVGYANQSWGTYERAVVAINGWGFGDTGPAFGGIVHGGTYAKRFDDYSGHSGFAWLLNRTAMIGPCVHHRSEKQIATFYESNGTTPVLQIDGINRPRLYGELIAYTAQYGNNTGTDNTGVEVKVQLTRPLLLVADNIGNARSLAYGQGSQKIPFDCVILSASGDKGNQLYNYYNGLRTDKQVKINMEISNLDAATCGTYIGGYDWAKTYASIGGDFQFLKQGVVQRVQDTNLLYRDARTAIAYDYNYSTSHLNYIYFVLVDGVGWPFYYGMTLTEMAWFCRDVLGCTDGINQDGGGSSTMVVNGVVRNAPGDLNQSGERAVANGMMMTNTYGPFLSNTYSVGQIVTTTQYVLPRLGPGTVYEADGSFSLGSGTNVTIADHPLRGVYAQGYFWYKISYGGYFGWVKGTEIRISGTGPTITSQPSSRSVCSGSSTSFSVAATGVGTLYYRWQKNGVDLTAGGHYPTVTSSTLTVTSADSTTVGDYRCRVTDANGSVYSNAAHLTVNIAPVIVAQNVQDINVCAGGTIAYWIQTSGSNVTYQWYKYVYDAYGNPYWRELSEGEFDGRYTGVETSTFQITNVGTTDTALFCCVASNTCGSATSNAGRPTLMSLSITQNPSDVTVWPCEPASFHVSANVVGATYRWHYWNGSTWVAIYDGGVFAGAGTDTLYITDGSQAPSYYCCRVSGACGDVWSDWAVLNVNYSCWYIWAGGGDVSTCPGTMDFQLGCRADPAECAGYIPPLSYQWLRWDGYDWVAMYNDSRVWGATTNTLHFNPVEVGDAGSYTCQVWDGCGRVEYSNPHYVTVYGSVNIIQHPVNQTVCPPNTAQFTVGAYDATWFQWQKSTDGGTTWANVTDGSGGTTSIYTTPATTTAMNGYKYRCIVGNPCGSTTSSSATLSLPCWWIWAGGGDLWICAGTMDFQLGCRADPAECSANPAPLSYQWYKWNGSVWVAMVNDSRISGVTTNTVHFNPVQVTDAGSYRCKVWDACGRVEYSTQHNVTVYTTPTITQQPTSQAVCAPSTAQFSIVASYATNYQWQRSTDGGTTWANVTDGSGGTTATYTTPATTSTMNGYRYRCVAYSPCGSVTSNSATLTVTATTITAHPQSVSVCPGASTSFSVAATGSSLTYQWRKGTVNITNGGHYSGATTATLLVSNVDATDVATNYNCVVTGTCGTATSNNASLALRAATAITTQPTSKSVCPSATTTFSVVATGDGTLTYQWQKNGVNLVNGGHYSGVTTATLTVSSASTEDAASYRCVVTGGCGSATSNSATLTLYATTAITTQPVNATVSSGGTATFSVVAAGSSLTYQWQKNGVNLTNGGHYSGVNLATLTISDCTSTEVGNYRCVVTGTCGSATSIEASLALLTGLTIIVDLPDSRTTGTGCPLTLHISASGTGILTYQWQKAGGKPGLWTNLKDGPVYTGAATATLFFDASAGIYRCRVTDSTATIYSNECTVVTNWNTPCDE